MQSERVPISHDRIPQDILDGSAKKANPHAAMPSDLTTISAKLPGPFVEKTSQQRKMTCSCL